MEESIQALIDKYKKLGAEEVSAESVVMDLGPLIPEKEDPEDLDLGEVIAEHQRKI